MPKLCQTKMTLSPYPPPPWARTCYDAKPGIEVTTPSLIPKYTGHEHRVSEIFPLLSTLYILAGVAGKIRIHFSQFSETTALCCKNISIMAALCPTLHIEYCAQNYAGIIRQAIDHATWQHLGENP